MITVRTGIFFLLLAAGLTGAAVAANGLMKRPFGKTPAAPLAAVPADFDPNQLPSVFRKNMGQWPGETLYLGSASGVQVRFMEKGLSFAVSREAEEETTPEANITESEKREVLVWNLIFENRSPGTVITTDGGKNSRTNYIYGNDPDNWHSNVPDYSVITYRGIYPATDLRYYYSKDQLKYDYILNPGSDIRRIRMRMEGVLRLFVNGSGQLEISTLWGMHVEDAPVAFQVVRGRLRYVDVRYELPDASSFGFRICGRYDPSAPLIIDPYSVKWSTYMKASASGTDNNYAYDIAMDNNGNIYITGKCDAAYPVTGGVYQGTYGNGLHDAFVTKLNRNGATAAYSTYLGGSGDDYGYGIAVTASGEAYVTGGTTSTNFPRLGAIQNTYNGNTDVFVTKLNSTGTALVYSTYLGGGGSDYGNAMDINASGEAFITGATSSTNFPTQSAYDNSLDVSIPGTYDAFAARLNAAGGALVYSTYLGGYDNDRAEDIAINASGEAFITGNTYATNYPSTVGPAHGGGTDAFVTRIASSGTTLVYSRFLGGLTEDQGRGIAVNASNEAYVTGTTVSADFPVLNALQPSKSPLGYDAFVTRLTANGSGYVYSTFLGGAGGGSTADAGVGIAVNAANEAYIVGQTQSAVFPVTAGAVQSVKAGGTEDIFLAHLCASGSAYCCAGATYYGGNANDYIEPKIVLDESGVIDTVMVVATTHSTNFPTTPGAFQTSKLNGINDQPVLFKMTTCPTPLPVELLEFTGERREDGIRLHWQAASEQNLDYYGVERKIRGEGNFNTVGIIPVAGNSTSSHSYRFNDPVATSGGREILYRLRQVDYDGSYAYSGTVSILAAETGLLIILDVAVGNTGFLSVQLQLPGTGNVIMEIYDLTGQRVLQHNAGLYDEGIHEHMLDVRNLSEGMYYLKVDDGRNNVMKEILLY